MDNNIIEIKDIHKSYDATEALKKVNLKVKKGELFGLIGPDGSGKTSLIRILATLILPDSGCANVLGLDVVKHYAEIRNRIGYMPGKFALYQDLTVKENIELFASIFDSTLEENYELVKPIYSQIEPFSNRKAGKLSGGMKQKLALSCALIHKPELLFLDEPTTGVDPVSRKEFWEMLRNLKEHDISIFVSTPYMDEAALCDRVALIQGGDILKIDTPQKIAESFNEKLFYITSDNMYMLLKNIRKYEFVSTVYPFGDGLHYTDVRDNFDINDIIEYLESNGLENIILKQIDPNIEDAFMKLMTKQIN